MIIMSQDTHTEEIQGQQHRPTGAGLCVTQGCLLPPLVGRLCQTCHGCFWHRTYASWSTSVCRQVWPGQGCSAAHKRAASEPGQGWMGPHFSLQGPPVSLGSSSWWCGHTPATNIVAPLHHLHYHYHLQPLQLQTLLPLMSWQRLPIQVEDLTFAWTHDQQNVIFVTLYLCFHSVTWVTDGQQCRLRWGSSAPCAIDRLLSLCQVLYLARWLS